MKYEMPGRVRFSEVDQHGVLTLYHLINYLQDSSTFHAEDRMVGMDWCNAQGIAWVLACWQLHVRTYPKLGDRIVVKTWPYSFRGFLGSRNYSIETEDGELLVTANSEWVLMDLKKNRPVRVSKDMMEAYQANADDKLQEDLGDRKIAIWEDGEEKEHFQIQEHMLDTNHHVNNGQYILMSEKYMEEGFRAVHFRAEYKKQAYLGDEIMPKVCKKDSGYQVVLENTEGEAYFIGEFLNC